MKLFVTDLDYTLLNSNKEISSGNLMALKKLEENNVKFVFASGRSYDDICEIKNKYGLVCPVIGLNGAQIIGEDGNVINKSIIPLNDVLPIISFCNKHNLIYRIFTNNLTFINQSNNLVYELFELAKDKAKKLDDLLKGAQIYYDSLFKKSVKVNNLALYLQKNKFEIYKVEVTTSQTEILKMLHNFISKNKKLYVTSSYSKNLEITRGHTDKGNAIKILAEFMKIQLKDVAAIGDNLNDKPMIEAAGIGIAMGNALDEVKRVSNYITKHYDDDGVAHIINTILERRKIS